MSQGSPSCRGMSRRSALKIGAAGCTSAAVVASSISTKPFSTPDAKFSQWQSTIGQDFNVRTKSFERESLARPVALRLVDVVKEKTKTQFEETLPSHIPEYSISLLFEGDMRAKLGTASYQVMHPTIGSCDLLINEIQPHSNATTRTFQSIQG